MNKDPLPLVSAVSGLNEDWDFATADTTYLTHSIHPYLAAMIPQIPKKLLELYAEPGFRLFDPFVGGGSVLVEAYLAGLNAVGLDINPLAVTISQAKTSPISSETLEHIRQEFEINLPKTKFTVPDFSEKSNVSYWFKPYMFEPLAQIRATINALVERIDGENRKVIKNFLECIFSNTVRSVSLTYRNEIRLRRFEPDDFERFNPNVLDEFRKRLEDASRRVALLPAFSSVPQVFQGDARQLSFADDEFDLVITSPPYGDIANTVPYPQFSKNMLYWLGLNDDEIAAIRDNSLGSRRTIINGFFQVPSFRASVEAMTKNEAEIVATRFYSDYYQALDEIARVTSKRICIVVGHRVLNNVLIDNPLITTEIMENLGWSLDERFDRSLKRKRLSKEMGIASSHKGATIDREAILVYVPT